MTKINYEALPRAKFEVSNELVFDTRIVYLASWAQYKEAQNALIASTESLKEWYEEQGNLENVVMNIKQIYDTLLDNVAEEHHQELINRGLLELDKDDLKEKYESCTESFLEGFKYITDFWYDATANEEQKNAYRAARKENRGRFVGYGSMLYKAEAGMANLATGFAHGAFNAIANGIGNIQKGIKLDNFYEEEKTFNSLSEGWEETYWAIYNTYIEIYNNNIIEGKDLLFNYSELLKYWKSAETQFENLEKARVSCAESLEALIKIISTFPFDSEYWQKWLENMSCFFKKKCETEDMNECLIFYLMLVGNCKGIIDYAGVVNKYDDDFYSDIVETVTQELFYLYFWGINNKQTKSLAEIKSIIDKDCSEYCTDGFLSFFNDYANEKVLEKTELLSVKKVISDFKLDESSLFSDEDFAKTYQSQIDMLSYSYTVDNKTSLLEIVKNKNAGLMKKILESDDSLSLRGIINSLSKILMEDENIVSSVFIKSINELGKAVDPNLNIDSFENYKELLGKAIAIEKSRKEAEEKRIADEKAMEEKIAYEKKAREEKYNFLKEDDRIYKALKFRERKGFFKHILPASWLITVLFYGLVSFIGLIGLAFIPFPDTENYAVLVGVIVLLFPLLPFIFGIKKRLKYKKERKWWEECTGNGKEDIKDVFSEFQEIEKEYIGI